MRVVTMRALTKTVLAMLLSASLAASAAAASVGERHLVAHEASAALRNASRSDELRITVWYPAAPGAVEAPLDIGPPGKPLFTPGSAAPDAAFEDARPRPVILLSHGFGGTARIMAWFGTALARHGYVVVAVDHPGNNGRDPMTVGGAVLNWERPGDLAVALEKVKRDSSLGPHLDLNRLGAAGFSAGGFTSLVEAGARVDSDRFLRFCDAHPDDGMCASQKEFQFSRSDAELFLAQPAVAPALAHRKDDLSIPGVKAAFVMAPGIVQSLDPESLKGLRTPVAIVLGDADKVAPPATNGEVAAALIPGAKLTVLPRVGHYDFLAECTPAGDAAVPVCPTDVPRAATHKVTIDGTLALFGATLGGD
jgi:predicted dienelactone hydrolase